MPVSFDPLGTGPRSSRSCSSALFWGASEDGSWSRTSLTQRVGWTPPTCVSSGPHKFPSRGLLSLARICDKGHWVSQWFSDSTIPAAESRVCAFPVQHAALLDFPNDYPSWPQMFQKANFFPVYLSQDRKGKDTSVMSGLRAWKPSCLECLSSSPKRCKNRIPFGYWMPTCGPYFTNQIQLPTTCSHLHHSCSGAIHPGSLQ